MRVTGYNNMLLEGVSFIAYISPLLLSPENKRFALFSHAYIDHLWVQYLSD